MKNKQLPLVHVIDDMLILFCGFVYTITNIVTPL